MLELTLTSILEQSGNFDAAISEYEALINAADFISILKLKARHLLDSAIQ